MAILEDLEAFRPAYDAWLERVRPLLLEKRWKEAFVGFPFAENREAPFAPLAKPLAECRLGLFSTAGLYVKETQEAFDAANIEGDLGFREVPLETPRERLGIAHEHYDHSVAEADLNSVFPVDRLRELVREGRIGALAPVAVTISGYSTQLDRIATETAPAIVEVFRRQQVDAVLHVPV